MTTPSDPGGAPPPGPTPAPDPAPTPSPAPASAPEQPTTPIVSWEAPTEEVPFVTQGSDDGESAPEMTTETTAAATATTDATAGEDSLSLPFEELADEARARQNDRVVTESADADFEECLTRVGLDDHVVVDQIDFDQTYLLVMRRDPEAERLVTFVVLPACEIVYVG